MVDNFTEMVSKLTEIASKLTEIASKLTEIASKLTEMGPTRTLLEQSLLGRGRERGQPLSHALITPRGRRIYVCVCRCGDALVVPLLAIDFARQVHVLERHSMSSYTSLTTSSLKSQATNRLTSVSWQTCQDQRGSVQLLQSGVTLAT